MVNLLGFAKILALIPGITGSIELDKFINEPILSKGATHRRLRQPLGTPQIDEVAQAEWDKAKRAGGKIYPRSSVTETARRATQIYYGQLTESNGLVRLGSLRSRPNGLFIQQRWQ